MSFSGPAGDVVASRRKWPCRCIGCAIIVRFLITKRTRSPWATSIMSASGNDWPPIVQRYGLLMSWARSRRISRSGFAVVGARARRAGPRRRPSAPAASPARAPTASSTAARRRSAASRRRGRSCRAAARRCGRRPGSSASSRRSARSPMPRRTASPFTGSTAWPSLATSVSGWPSTENANSVSAAALITRRRTRSPRRTSTAVRVAGRAAVDEVERELHVARVELLRREQVAERGQRPRERAPRR